MLIHRKLVDLEYKNIYDVLKKSLESSNDEVAIFNENVNNKKYVIKFMNKTIQTLKKSPDVQSFVDNYNNDYKFLIVLNMSDKLKKSMSTYINLEIFTISDVVINVIEHYLQPEFKLLNNEEKDKFNIEYDLKNKDFPRMYNTDPIARYYNAKSGDIFEIKRFSPISGYSVIYRLVVPGIMV